MQLYFLQKIINALLQIENILEELLGIICPNEVIKTGGIVKQSYFLKNVHGKNLYEKLHVNIFHENK